MTLISDQYPVSADTLSQGILAEKAVWCTHSEKQAVWRVNFAVCCRLLIKTSIPKKASNPTSQVTRDGKFYVAIFVAVLHIIRN